MLLFGQRALQSIRKYGCYGGSYPMTQSYLITNLYPEAILSSGLITTKEAFLSRCLITTNNYQSKYMSNNTHLTMSYSNNLPI
uniref:Uncharacterized protein n=1 Tax=Picea glauca TaxID=3330 RepID=A0A101M1U1_PICGL|nr:hypothetical protein ABT39_MTgene3958 [Picea glauca]QHR91071.1 hypothetical protein Q903MT_gene5103 [Picea sitchensis]